VAKRLRVARALKWDQEFESAFLQRRITCEPEDHIDKFAFDVAGALEAVVALAERAGIEVGGVEASGRDYSGTGKPPGAGLRRFLF
jgi:hypothetical protein